MSEAPEPAEERRECGRSLRETVPLDSHAAWSPGTERANSVELLEAQNESRISWLVPLRRARMAVSPFTFYRGAARIMTHDLATTPVSGLETQICGDAHLANFGSYASPERRLVFDLNDFDETLPGPWEWDVKRLAASFVLAGRHNGLSGKECGKITRRAVRGYREAMASFAEMRLTDICYSLIHTARIFKSAKDREVRQAGAALVKKSMRKNSLHALDKLTEEVDGEFRIRSEAPLLVPLRDVQDRSSREKLADAALQAFEDYQKTVPDEVEHLLKRFRPVDFAVKAVGVGSVGTQCFILHLEGRDRHDPLFLQIKEAVKSVLEEHLPQSRYQNSGRRVVEGQRLMQAVSDCFLGWTETREADRHFYVRQLKDWKGSDDVDNASAAMLDALARARDWTLARPHRDLRLPGLREDL